MKRILIVIILLFISIQCWSDVVTSDYLILGYKYQKEIFGFRSPVLMLVEELDETKIMGYTVSSRSRGKANKVVLDTTYKDLDDLRWYMIHELMHVYQINKLGYKPGWSTSIKNASDYEINFIKMAFGKVNPEMEAEIVAAILTEVLKFDTWNRGKKYNKPCLRYIKREFPKLYQTIISHPLY